MNPIPFAIGFAGLLVASSVLTQTPPVTGGENYKSVSSSFKDDVDVGAWNYED